MINIAKAFGLVALVAFTTPVHAEDKEGQSIADSMKKGLEAQGYTVTTQTEAAAVHVCIMTCVADIGSLNRHCTIRCWTQAE
jgi:hypothetical protein